MRTPELQTYKDTKTPCAYIWLVFTSAFYNSLYFNFYSGTKLQGDYFAWCFNEPLVGLNYVAICLSVDYNPVWLANDWYSSKIFITGLYLRTHFEITLNMNTASTFHQILDSILLIYVSKSNSFCCFITDMKTCIYPFTSFQFLGHKRDLPFTQIPMISVLVCNGPFPRIPIFAVSWYKYQALNTLNCC